MNFDERLDFRLRKNELKIILSIINKKRNNYDNVSHFIRCAILKLINEEQKDEKKL